MKILFQSIGKSSSPYIQQEIEEYGKRIRRYAPFEYRELDGIKGVKSMDAETYRRKEGELILKSIDKNERIILLDAKGKVMDSESFADYIASSINIPSKICFICGGPYGFSEAVYQKANAKISLSSMTFSHQIVRVVFMEQLYRAFTLINNHPYHNN